LNNELEILAALFVKHEETEFHSKLEMGTFFIGYTLLTVISVSGSLMPKTDLDHPEIRPKALGAQWLAS
jgi:hypothetical protein